jgi:hypothetical protein
MLTLPVPAMVALAELPLDGRARGIVDLQGKCLDSSYMRRTSGYPGGGCPEYIRGVQLELEWADAEPAPGAYNFSAIESGLQQVASLGKYAVVNV